ncbi:hypothetical protein VNO78_12523 [Psophocarpus tetragonolobus]|uniref:ADP-ribosyl cyclase/cyclic ADP-ribose hydrolase n=1 Tax=Psophocarpus tetragonolobus TaxID=3891 RepID=A0AAN9XPC2_PSOTE
MWHYEPTCVSGLYSNPYHESATIYYGVLVFAYKDLERATKRFDHSRQLGEGAFGIVYHCMGEIGKWMVVIVVVLGLSFPRHFPALVFDKILCVFSSVARNWIVSKNTRANFTSYLYEALKQKGVETYIDYWLERGEEISLAVIKAIKDSHISVIVLSDNYASSKWCLEELNEILDRKKKQEQIVIQEGWPNEDEIGEEVTQPIPYLKAPSPRGTVEILMIPESSPVPTLPSSQDLLPSIEEGDKVASQGTGDVEEIESINVHSESLRMLYLCECPSLNKLSVTSKQITTLGLGNTSIHAFLSTMLQNTELSYLCLDGCNVIDELSDDSGMGSVTVLDHYGYKQPKMLSLQALLHNIGHFTSLDHLSLKGSNVESLPANIKNLSSLRVLRLSCCRELMYLQELPPSLIDLDLNDCTKLMNLAELPSTIPELSLLKSLQKTHESTRTSTKPGSS